MLILRRAGLDVDVFFICGKEDKEKVSVRAHQLALIKLPYFEKLFRSDDLEQNDDDELIRIECPEFSPDALDIVIR